MEQRSDTATYFIDKYLRTDVNISKTGNSSFDANKTPVGAIPCGCPGSCRIVRSTEYVFMASIDGQP